MTIFQSHRQNISPYHSESFDNTKLKVNIFLFIKQIFAVFNVGVEFPTFPHKVTDSILDV